MKKKIYITPAIANILADTANSIMLTGSNKDVNEDGTNVNTGNDHGSGNAWEGGCAKENPWSTDDYNYQN